MSKAAVIYWSGTGNTQAMAEGIVKGMQESGVEAQVFSVAEAPADVRGYDVLAFGCPSMGTEELEDSEFLPYFESVEGQLAGKKVALFGSYGWGDGEWMRNWVEKVQEDNAALVDNGFIVQGEPDEGKCVAYGKKCIAG